MIILSAQKGFSSLDFFMFHSLKRNLISWKPIIKDPRHVYKFQLDDSKACSLKSEKILVFINYNFNTIFSPKVRTWSDVKRKVFVIN